MYNQPFKKVGKVDPTMKNQSKSSFYLTDSTGPGDEKNKQKQDSSNTLPSYDTTTYDASASASGSSSSSNSSSTNLSTNNLSNYQSTLKDLGPDFKPTPEQTAAANKKVAELKALDAKNATANAASSRNSQTSTETRNTTTTTIGNQTLNQIQTGGNIAAQNRINKAKAQRHAARNQAVSDSTNVANAYLNKLPASAQLSTKHQNIAQFKGNQAAKQALAKNKAFTPSEINRMVKSREHYLGNE